MGFERCHLENEREIPHFHKEQRINAKFRNSSKIGLFLGALVFLGGSNLSPDSLPFARPTTDFENGFAQKFPLIPPCHGGKNRA